MTLPPSDRLIVVAFGGNALQRPGERGTVEEMRLNLRAALAGLEPALRAGTPLLITHGNGPQVGSALLRSEAAAREVPPHPLDVAVATTQAEIGSLVVGELLAAIRALGLPERAACALVTHVLVDPQDEKLLAPTKPIGPFYDEATAHSLERGRGWALVEDAGRGWRRVVGSPTPHSVVELESIRALVERGTIVVAGGGGGIPVARTGAGDLAGVEAVIDKDHTASLLAQLLDADQLVILTAVDAVYSGFGTEEAVALNRLSVVQARELLDTGTLPAGSMAPKVEAAAEFAHATGRTALITNESGFATALAGSGGTTIYSDR